MGLKDAHSILEFDTQKTQQNIDVRWFSQQQKQLYPPFHAGEGCGPIRPSYSIEIAIQDRHCHSQSPCEHRTHVSPVVCDRVIAK